MPKPKKPKPAITREELESLRESRRMVRERFQEANAMWRTDPDRALRRLEEAEALLRQFKTIVRTYLRRLKAR